MALLEAPMVTRIYSDDPNLQLEATTQFRNLLSSESYSLIEEVVNANIVPQFVEFLTRHDFPQLQFEAAWTLTIIISRTPDHTRIVVDHGVVPHLVELLSSPIDDIREMTVCGLGNIALNNPTCRDLVLRQGALRLLVAQLNENNRYLMLRIAAFALSAFLSGEPQAPLEQIMPALPLLQSLIHSDDEEILTGVCWALYFLSNEINEGIQAVIEAGVCRRLIELLIHPSSAVLIPALGTIGNIVSGDILQKEFMIDSHLLRYLSRLITSNHNFEYSVLKSIMKEISFTISSIAEGNRSQIQAVLEANIIPTLVQLLQNAELDIMKELAPIIYYVTLFASEEQIKCLVEQGCIKPLCDLLDCIDPTIVILCLEGLEIILEVGEIEKQLGNTAGMKLHCQYIHDAGGLEKIENLLSHNNDQISAKAEEVLIIYWQSDENDENIASDDTLP